MTRQFAAAISIAAALVTGACLDKETTSTIYLEADGSATWVVVEDKVRSTEETSDKRQAEEASYLEAVTQADPPVAQAMRFAGAREVTTRLLRGEPPFTVRTEARFNRVTDLFAHAFEGCGVVYASSLTPEGPALRWTLDVLVDPEPDAVDEDSCPDLSALYDAIDNLRVVSADAVVVEFVGFSRISADEVELTEPDEEAIKANGGWWHLSLVWGPRS
jgi:hypothetical protein